MSSTDQGGGKQWFFTIRRRFRWRSGLASPDLLPVRYTELAPTRFKSLFRGLNTSEAFGQAALAFAEDGGKVYLVVRGRPKQHFTSTCRLIGNRTGQSRRIIRNSVLFLAAPQLQDDQASRNAVRPSSWMTAFRSITGLRFALTLQLNRLLKLWVAEAGFDPTDYGVESLRRTKALHILKGTGDLQTLLGHATIESTARYLGLTTKADPITVCRAFDI
jgi:integrase